MGNFKAIAQFAPVYATYTQVVTAEVESSVIFNSDGDYEVDAVIASHAVAGTDAGAVNLVVRKWITDQTLAQGVSLTTAVHNLKGTINTPNTQTVVSNGDQILKQGDRIGILATGVMTAVDGVNVTVRLRRIAKIKN